VHATRQAAEIIGHHDERERRHYQRQPLDDDRPPPREQRCGTEIDAGQNDAARDNRLDDVVGHHDHIDADAQKVDHRGPDQPQAQTFVTAAPGRRVVALFELRRQRQERRLRLERRLDVRQQIGVAAGGSGARARPRRRVETRL
jgi:hypothetical protein